MEFFILYFYWAKSDILSFFTFSPLVSPPNVVKTKADYKIYEPTLVICKAIFCNISPKLEQAFSSLIQLITNNPLFSFVKDPN